MSASAAAPIGSALARWFDLSHAELTLEGAPAYFALEDAALLRGCLALGARRVRISMGVQTFDPAWIERMGRTGFSSPVHVEAAVALARSLGVGTSADLLVNLPGQPLDAMLADIDRAVALGFDQICVYPLVLRAGLPAGWARDRELLDALPSTTQGFASWLAVIQSLRSAGYVQRTLTNFERADLDPGARFVYEPVSFRPATADAIGFGRAPSPPSASAAARPSSGRTSTVRTPTSTAWPQAAPSPPPTATAQTNPSPSPPASSPC